MIQSGKSSDFASAFLYSGFTCPSHIGLYHGYFRILEDGRQKFEPFVFICDYFLGNAFVADFQYHEGSKKGSRVNRLELSPDMYGLADELDPGVKERSMIFLENLDLAFPGDPKKQHLVWSKWG